MKERDVTRAAYLIPEFCAAYRISEPYYYVMRKEGKGPRELRLGKRKPIITMEAAADWEKQRAKESAA